MILCKGCDIRMIGVTSLSKEKHERFCKCPKCYSTIRKKIEGKELDFGEVLHKEIYKGRYNSGSNN